jgi:transporter family-2 protein
MEALFVPMSLVAGGLLAVQAGANTQLSKVTGSPFAATLLQLSVGAVALTLLALATGSLIALADLTQVPWWHAIGGTASALFVVSTILLFPRLGAVVSVGLIIAGQMLASLVLDGFGLLGVPATGFGASTLVGSLAVLAGTAAIVLGQSGAVSDLSISKLGWILLALLAGAVLPVQGAVNGLLRAGIGAPLTVGAVSFLVATLAMALVMLPIVAFTDLPKPHLSKVRGMPWWGWLGGFVGALYVITMFMAIPVIGTAAAVGLTVAGQQVASVFVDRHGWFRLPVRPVSAVRLAGVAVLLVGVAIIKLL